MGKLNTVWSYLRRHKYLITFIIGLLMVGVVDENSFRKNIINRIRINELNAEIAQYEEDYRRDSVKLNSLLRDPRGIERVARERYLMKRDNEDVYIINEE